MLNSSRDKIKACTVAGRGEESLLCGPGSELLLGGSEKRSANTINGMKKKQNKKKQLRLKTTLTWRRSRGINPLPTALAFSPHYERSSK